MDGVCDQRGHCPMYYAEYRKEGSSSWWLLGSTRTRAGALAKIRAHRKRFGFGGIFKDEYRVTTG